MKKIISMFLLVATLLTCMISFSACNSGKNGGTETTGGEQATKPPEDTTERDEWGRELVYSDGSEALDYNNDKITILVRSDDGCSPAQFVEHEQMPDVYNSATVRRNSMVQEYLNVTLDLITRERGTENTNMNSYIRNQIDSGAKECPFDIIANHCFYGSILATEGRINELVRGRTLSILPLPLESTAT